MVCGFWVMATRILAPDQIETGKIIKLELWT